MSTPRTAQPAKLLIGMLSGEKNLISEVADQLTAVYGPVDMVSPYFAFDYTDYYRAEMGAPLFRRLLVFERLIDQSRLSDIKLKTNELEMAYSARGQRRVNIDPGYLLLERFVLATGKNYSHRIYIGEGIYADLTLIFQKGAYQPLPWTYPDYADDSMRVFLKQVRRRYGDDLKEAHPKAFDSNTTPEDS